MGFIRRLGGGDLMIAGSVATQTGDAPYDFSAFPEVKLDFENGIYTVGGSAVALNTLIGGANFQSGSVGPQGMSVGNLDSPANAPQAIGALFKALRDGVVAGMVVLCEFKTKYGVTESDVWGGILEAFFEVGYPNGSNSIYMASSGSQGASVADSGDAFARAVPNFNGGTGPTGQVQRIAGLFASDPEKDGGYLYAVSANGQSAVYDFTSSIHLPELLQRIDLFAVEPWGYYPDEWFVRKFEVRQVLTTVELAALSSVQPIAAVSNLAKSSGGQTSYTFSGFATGTAAANRLCVVGLVAADAGYGVALTSAFAPVEIGGIVATRVAGIDNLEMWQALVPSGTTADVVVYYANPVRQAACRLWHFETDDVTPYDSLGGASASGANITLTDLAVKNAGYVIAMARSSATGSGASWSWTGSETLTETDDYNLGGIDAISTIEFSPTSDSLTQDLTLDSPASASTDVEVLAVSWKTSATAKDPWFAQVVLLAGFNGTDASTTFTDESAAPHTLTASGNAQIDTAQKAFGTASALFDGTNDYISAADSADWQLVPTAGDECTIEAWVNFTGAGNSSQIIGQEASSTLSNAANAWSLMRNGTGLELRIHNATSNYQIQASANSLVGAFFPVRATIDNAGLVSLFVNGALVGSSTPANATMRNAATALTLGCAADSSLDFQGWIDEVRLTKGRARGRGLKKYYVDQVAFPRA